MSSTPLVPTGDSTPPVMTPEWIRALTYKELTLMPADEYKKLIANAIGRARVEEILLERSNAIVAQQAEELRLKQEKELANLANDNVSAQVPEEPVVAEPAAPEPAVVDQAAADKAAAEQAAAAEAKRLADEAEADRLALEEKQRIAREARPTRIIVEYQAKDDEGRSIGRPTHLEAETFQEMIEKQKECHIQAVRYAERLKRRQSKETPQPVEPPLPILSDADRATFTADAQSTDPAKAEIASLKLALDEAARATRAARIAEDKARGARVSYEFMGLHAHDFKPCQANAGILAQYIRDNKLDWTVENLESAFVAMESQLAPPDRPVVSFVEPAVVAAPTPVPVSVAQVPQSTPAANTPAPAPAVVPAPVAAAPAPAVPPATMPNASAPAPRKLPAGGIQPGSLHGGRPVTKTPALTRRDILRMPKDEFKYRLVRDPNFRKQCNAVGIDTSAFEPK